MKFLVLLVFSLFALTAMAGHVNFVAGAAAPFTPNSISGLTLWYDMQNVSGYAVSGSAITDLFDLSASGNNANQPTTGDRFTYVASAINTHPAMQRTGSPTSQKMILSSSMKAIPQTIGVVGLWTGDAGNIFGGTSFNYYWDRLNFGGFDTYDDPGECGTTTGVTINVGFFELQTMPSTTASATSFYLNNTLLTQNGCAGTYGGGTGVNWLGGNSFQAGNNFKGYIGEIVVYNSALGSTDRTNLYNYEKTKWGTP